MELSFLGAKVRGIKSTWERKFHNLVCRRRGFWTFSLSNTYSGDLFICTFCNRKMREELEGVALNTENY